MTEAELLKKVGIAPPPDLDRLDQVILCTDLRRRRAAVRLARAQAESRAADEAHELATAERLEWIAANPDPQMIMF